MVANHRRREEEEQKREAKIAGEPTFCAKRSYADCDHASLSIAVSRRRSPSRCTLAPRPMGPVPPAQTFRMDIRSGMGWAGLKREHGLPDQALQSAL